MWINEKFLDTQKLKRDGKLVSLTLPKGAKVLENTYKLNIKPKSLEFVKGNNAYIISDEIGISEGVTFSFFFMSDCLCACVTEGLLYVKDENGNIFSINHKNKIVKSDNKIDKIIWKSVKDMRDYVFYITQGKYNLISPTETQMYEDNLLYTAKADYVPAQGNLFTIKFVEVSEALGGSFKFIVKEKIEQKRENKPLIDEDKYLYAEEDSYTSKSRKVKKPSKYSISDDKGDEMDDYDEGMEDLSESMHEINIFNDYTSLDEPV